MTKKKSHSHYWMCGASEPSTNCILREELPDGCLVRRASYKHLECPNCHKLDEPAALAAHVDPGIRIRGRRPFVSDLDDILCANSLALSVMRVEKIRGFRPIPLPKGDYAILMPERFTPVDMAKSPDMKLLSVCDACGRPRETTGWPSLASIPLPSDPRVVLCPSPQPEHWYGRAWWFLVSEEVMRVFKSHGLTKVHYVPAT